jgi:hypothetical protein
MARRLSDHFRRLENSIEMGQRLGFNREIAVLTAHRGNSFDMLRTTRNGAANSIVFETLRKSTD